MTAPLDAAELIVLDVVGTLIHPQPPAAVVYQKLGRQFGSRLSPQQIQDRLAKAFVHQEKLDLAEGGLATSEQREQTRWQQIVAEVFVDLPKTNELFATLWEHFSQAENWAAFPDAVELTSQLNQHNLPWAMASNFDSRLRTVLKGLRQLPSPQGIFISSEVGYRKPSVDFFTTITEHFQASPEQTLMIGDSLWNDHEPAQTLRWRSRLVDRQGRYLGQPGVISSLQELIPELIGPG